MRKRIAGPPSQLALVIAFHEVLGLTLLVDWMMDAWGAGDESSEGDQEGQHHPESFVGQPPQPYPTSSLTARQASSMATWE